MFIFRAEGGMELNDFFGMDFNIKKFDINILLDLLSIRRKIEDTKQVKQIAERFGKHSSYVLLAKRQQTLNYFRPLLESSMLEYDSIYYAKAVNTASDRDRRYNSEEKLLELVLIVATGKTLRDLHNSEFKPTVEVLRGVKHAERFDRIWDVLTRETRDLIVAFKKEM